VRQRTFHHSENKIMNPFPYRRLLGLLVGSLLATSVHAASTAPVATRLPTPEYDWELRRDRVEGSVTVIYTVKADGSVSQAKIISATNRVFVKPVLNAVGSWKFDPAKHDGRAIECQVQQEIRFSLAPETPPLVAAN
jgi:TonB family protein